MPKAFLDCVQRGGKVRTIVGPDKQWGLKAGEFRRVCIEKDPATGADVARPGEKRKVKQYD